MLELLIFILYVIWEFLVLKLKIMEGSYCEKREGFDDVCGMVFVLLVGIEKKKDRVFVSGKFGDLFIVYDFDGNLMGWVLIGFCFLFVLNFILLMIFWLIIVVIMDIVIYIMLKYFFFDVVVGVVVWIFLWLWMKVFFWLRVLFFIFFVGDIGFGFNWRIFNIKMVVL